jgi:glycosyltransferase involved in cell wall biosynthesis
MNINIFLLCYNESVLLPHTIKHYKKYLPSCKITIYDNHSTDNSVEIAKSLGCNCIPFETENITNDFKMIEIKNNAWKEIQNGWIIMADMDEFLCITEEELREEIIQGTTILKIQGKDMIGESNTLDLTDIDLQDIKKYVYNTYLDKKLCFLREKITEINYECGAHICNPIGEIKYSSKIYTNKHMCHLGLKFITNKMKERYKRTIQMREKHDMCIHYSNDDEHITNEYMNLLKNCNLLEEIS